MNYLCLIDGVVEFGSTSLHEFARYFVMYDEEVRQAEENNTLEILNLTDEELAAMFPVEDEEE
jgi:hypothetical protein